MPVDLHDMFKQGITSPPSAFAEREANPMISIVMPIHNQGEVLEETLASIASQSFFDYELLCIDDGSHDYSIGIVEARKKLDGRLHLLQRPHEGAAKARNFGLSQAVGKYVVFLDSDDLFRPDYLECIGQVVASVRRFFPFKK